MEHGAQHAFQDHTVTGLTAVLTCPVSVHDGPAGLLPLLGVLRDAVAVDGLALVSKVVPEDSAVIASCGLDGDAFATLAGMAGRLVAAAEDGDVPAVPGVPVAACVPLPGARGDVALVVVSVGGLSDALAHVTVAVAAERLGAAIEVGRLRGDLDRAMAQILESDERMLGRIGLDIHDGPTQHLSVALLEIQLLEADLGDAAAGGATLPDGLMPALERIYETLGGALTEMRELIGHLRPAQFEDRRLTEILQDAISGFESRSGATVHADMRGEFPVNGVSVTQRITFYRILQEALNNAHRHGRARTVRVGVTESEDGITMEVADDGGGFDAENALRPRTGAPIARFGLHGMRDRASVLGGTFDVRSGDGEGTTVRVFLPRWRPGDGIDVPSVADRQ